jgi:hypothetical protein
MAQENVLTTVRSGLDDVAKLGAIQVEAREGAIQIVNELCDSLQLAADLIAHEISKTVAEYHETLSSPDTLHGFLRRTAIRFSEPSLWVLLHEGKVCGSLHALGDRFRQGGSREAWSAVPFWETILAFFVRSTSMSRALQSLVGGEKEYLRSIASFLRDVQQEAEVASSSKDAATLVATLRAKRAAIGTQARELREAGDACIAKLA